MEKIKGLEEFLKVKSGCGSGTGDGYGNGSGNGDGYGCGYDGHKYGYIPESNGSGNSYGCGYGSGYGSGDGYCGGNGSGYGYGSGSGENHSCGYSYDYDGGFSCNYKISLFNNDVIYTIDTISTIIKSVKGNIAKGFILNNDFSLDKCFVVKDGNLFAHGKTLKEAIQSLNEKKWANLDTDKVIGEFCKVFKKGKRYKGSEFFKWHNYLTGSCLQGRETFVKNHDLSLDDEFTVDEFIKLTEEDYGGKIIKQLKEVWEEKYC